MIGGLLFLEALMMGRCFNAPLVQKPLMDPDF